ncbi:MAG TPA: ABC-2 family transporter protein [Mycobacteriales bacterium]|nr:ABC-2 family transporter protein [Mycobacteriales bacterium]
MRQLRMYGILLRAGMRSQMQYRANFALITIGGFAYQGVGLAFLWIVVARFGSLGGWSITDVALLYGMRLTAHGLWAAPSAQVLLIDLAIREGEFDRYLVRPVNPLIQLLTRSFSLQTISDLLGGVIVLVGAATASDIHWGPGNIGWLFAGLVGGALVEFAVYLAVSALSFRITSARSPLITVGSIMQSAGPYPLPIFPAAARAVLTFALPVAFIAYLPAAVLLHRTGEVPFASWLGYAAPAVGLLLAAISYRFWMRQLRRYASPGN